MTAAERAILLPLVAAALVVGLLIGGRWEIDGRPLALFVFASIALIALSVSLRRFVVPAVVVAVTLVGMLRGVSVDVPGRELTPHHGVSGIVVRGAIDDDPTGSRTISTFAVSVEQVRRGDRAQWTPVSGRILATARATAEQAELRDPPLFRYGDRIELRGRLESPRQLDDFDFPAYLRNQGISTVMSFPEVTLISEGGGNRFRHWLSSTRRNMAHALANAVPEPQAAFGQSILLGIRDNLPEEVVDDFRRTGASHLLAISGLHVGILMALATGAGAFVVGRRRQLYLLIPLAAIWLYTLLSGASPSAVRAALMGTTYVVAIAVGRPRSLTPSLALAAALMALFDPRVLHSVSFQLSFSAMIGIAIYHERLSEPLQEKLGLGPEHDGLVVQAARALVSAVGITVAATAATAPLVGFYFEHLPLMGLPTTLLAMPAVPLALIAHGVTAAVGVVSEVVALPFGWLAWGVSTYATGVVSLLARVPSTSISVEGIGYVLVWSYYAAIASIAVWSYGSMLRVSTGRRVAHVLQGVWDRSANWQVAAIAVLVAALVWAAVTTRPSGVLEVVFADVGQGDMTLITTPDGRRVVVDGGPDGVHAVNVLGGELPFWTRAVDMIVLTHPHADHVTGLNEILRRYHVGTIVERARTYAQPEYSAWTKLIGLEDAEVVSAQPGMVIAFGDGVSMQILGPPTELLSGTASDIDNGSVIFRVVYGRVSFLFTGDLFAEGEAWLIASGQQIDSDVLKVPHHGSRSSSTADFLDAVSPSVAVVSSGADNQFGHPAQEVMERLSETVPNSEIFLTAEDGAVTFETDGKSLWVKTE